MKGAKKETFHAHLTLPQSRAALKCFQKLRCPRDRTITFRRAKMDTSAYGPHHNNFFWSTNLRMIHQHLRASSYCSTETIPCVIEIFLRRDKTLAVSTSGAFDVNLTRIMIIHLRAYP